MNHRRAPTSSRAPHSALHHLDAFAHLAMTLLGCLGVAAAAGAFAALLIRTRHLAWNWALLALVPFALAVLAVAVLSPPFAAAAIPLTSVFGAALAAIVVSLLAHLGDLRAGGDRASAAATRRGLLDAVRRLLAERGGERARLQGIPIGRTARGELVCVPRGSERSGAHVLIPGATGAGKTTSLAALLTEYVCGSGFGAVVLEAKTDAALCEAARRAAAARGVPFRLITPEGPCGYDPLCCGSVDERSERLVSAQAWGSEDADFYRQAASPLLRLALRVLDVGPEPVTLAAVARHCDPDDLAHLALEVGAEDLAAEVDSAFGALRADERRAISGLAARLANLASSEFARAWLDPCRDGVHAVNLRAAIDAREVVYFRLDTDRTGNVGRAIAQIALLDLGAAASARMDAGVGAFVAIDEFGALEAPALERLFARGRAAGFSVAVGTQTLADLHAAGPAVRDRIGATVSAIVSHRLGGQADAEWVAKQIGTVPTWETTTRTNGLGLATSEGTRTRGYRYEVNPSQLQRLGRGEAIVARLEESSGQRSAQVRVVPAWQRLLPATPAPDFANKRRLLWPRKE